MLYKWRTGGISWILHRVTGVGITVYLLIHILTVSNLLKGETAFNKAMETVQQPIFILGEIALLGAIVFHALNGIRILIIDFGKGSLYQKKLFWIFMVLAAIIFVIGTLPILHLFTETFPGKV
jgi:succinate dehydrogenase / fumarate reductase, cytochrome b subunit